MKVFFSLADQRGGGWMSNFFLFHAVFGRIWQDCVFTQPPPGLTPPPRGNPGSATAFQSFAEIYFSILRDIYDAIIY